MAGRVLEAGAGYFRAVADARHADIDEMLRMSTLLDPGEAALIQAVYGRGMRPVEFARAMGCSKRQVTDRRRRILKRMKSALFRFVLQHERRWSFDRRTIGQSVILRGRTQRQTAQLLGVSIHYVRTELTAIRLLFEQQNLQPVDFMSNSLNQGRAMQFNFKKEKRHATRVDDFEIGEDRGDCAQRAGAASRSDVRPGR